MIRHHVPLWVTFLFYVQSTEINLDSGGKWDENKYNSNGYTNYIRYTGGNALSNDLTGIPNNFAAEIKDCELLAFAQAECAHAGYVCKHTAYPNDNRCYAKLYLEDKVNEFNQVPRGPVQPEYTFDANEVHTHLTLRDSVLGYRGPTDVAWGTGLTVAAWIKYDTPNAGDNYIRVFDFGGGPGNITCT